MNSSNSMGSLSQHDTRKVCERLNEFYRRLPLTAIRGCELRRLPTLLVGDESLKYNRSFGKPMRHIPLVIVCAAIGASGQVVEWKHAV